MKPNLSSAMATWACLALAAVSAAAAPPAPGEAAVLYGRLSLLPDHRPAARHAVKLNCPPAATETEALTDERGGFTMVVLGSARGSCRMWVEASGRRSDPVEVFVAGSSLRYDLVLDAQFRLTKR